MPPPTLSPLLLVVYFCHTSAYFIVVFIVLSQFGLYMMGGENYFYSGNSWMALTVTGNTLKEPGLVITDLMKENRFLFLNYSGYDP